MSLLGVFGGTFDPVHNGHLRSALELTESGYVDEVLFVPCGQPVHRAPAQASGKVRLELLRAATDGVPALSVSDFEVGRAEPSYTVETLEHLASTRAESLVLIAGLDAFRGFTRWRQWQRITELAHILVMARPGYTADFEAELAAHLGRHQVSDPAGFRERSSGCIAVTELTQLAISSSDIRGRLAAGQSVRFIVPDSVCALMQNSGYYCQGMSPGKGGGPHD